MASEKILVSGVTEILKKLLPVIGQQISQAWGVKDDLKKLGNTLESIGALISDAEEKQITDATVRLWLRRLKDVVYDADDVMDEFCYESIRRCERGSQLKHKVRDFVSKSSNPLVFHFKMAGKIRAIKKSLDEIYNDQDRYSLNATRGTSQDDRIMKLGDRLTASVVDDSVIGRKDAVSDVVKMLTNKMLPLVSPSTSSHNSCLQQKLSVVSIVGMGGLGKTSLAQLVYKDESIKTHFQKKIWVCVSDKFDVRTILKEIIESLTDDGLFGVPSNFDVLVRQVKQKLSGKKYLLVLDDLWNEDAGDWEKLQGVLVNDVEGSKLLVTTRSQKVASVVGGKVHNLQKLTNDDCWSIMQKKVSSPLPLNMINIGRDIAKKCAGLPLAANFLGSLLHLKRDERDWVSINDDKSLWMQPENKRVISILKLSYDNLASPIKQCFSYCCLFPKDWEIRRVTLIRLWMAEGFLQLSNEVKSRSFEEIGNDYFDFLSWNSFFQELNKDALGVILTCKMHDLVHDLAMSVVDRNEFGIDGKEEVSKVRRLQLIHGNGPSTTTLEVLGKARNLRTIFALDPGNHSQISNFSSAKRLRILYPLGDWYTGISFSISKFKHLRFLDLSKFHLSGAVSLNHSYNLETLILQRCKNFSGFLGEIGLLKNLRHLDVSRSDIDVLHDDFLVNLTNLQTLDLQYCIQLEALPENMKLLQHLSYLDLSSSSISIIPDSITCITNLMTLNLWQCQKLVALPAELGALTRLRFLDLSYTKIKELPESCINNLCNLEIVNFGDTCEFPKEIRNWPKLRQFEYIRNDYIMPRGMEKLTCLEKLEYMVRKEADIQACQSGGYGGIEELAALNNLQMLRIRSLENVRRGIEDAEKAKLKDKANLTELFLWWSSNEDDEDDDMVLEGLRPHPNLRILELYGFSGLNFPKWMGSSSNCLLPNLVRLKLISCNRCENFPALGMLPCLRELVLWGMKSVKCLGRELYHQQQQEEEESTQKSTAPTSSLFPWLVELKIMDMENLEEWVAPLNSFPLLRTLSVMGCQKFRSAPNSFPSLKNLSFTRTNGNAVNSILSPSRSGGCLTSLRCLQITESPELVCLSLGVLLQNDTSNLQILKLASCPGLTSLPDLRLWTSLRDLTIFECDRLKESIPYDLKTSLSFLDSLKVDFIQREDQQLPNPDGGTYALINLMKK